MLPRRAQPEKRSYSENRFEFDSACWRMYHRDMCGIDLVPPPDLADFSTYVPQHFFTCFVDCLQQNLRGMSLFVMPRVPQKNTL